MKLFYLGVIYYALGEGAYPEYALVSLRLDFSTSSTGFLVSFVFSAPMYKCLLKTVISLGKNNKNLQ